MVAPPTVSTSLEQELVDHARVLRGLARDLVGDRHADDLVQETALQALRAAPPRQQNLGAWLAGIVRHLASRHHRSERRRQRREQLAVRPEAEPAPTAAADREAFAQLTAAVLALPQPYQATILARYVRDLTPRQIAARTGVPVATVKTRLARALGLLRERLAREGLGRDWRAALGAAFGIDVLQPIAVTTTTGVLLMGAGAKLGLGGLAAALLAVAWWWGGERGSDARPVAAVDPASAAAAQQSVAGDAADRTAPRREELADPKAAVATVAVLRGRCVDTEGKPLAGCEVRARGVPGSPARVAAWQRDHGAFAWTDPQPAATGEDGTFVLRVPPTGPLAAEFAASAPGRAPATARWPQLDAGADVDLGDVALRREVRVRLHVVDAAGEALPDVGLSFRLDDNATEAAERRVGAITDAAGRAELVLAEGEHSISVSMINAWPKTLRVPGDAAEFDVELQLQGLRGVEFLGGVVLQKNGLPVANAFVIGGAAEDTEFYSTRTAADGRFVLGRPDGFPDVPQFLRCTADGHDTYVSPEPVPFGERNVQIVLEPGLAAEFHVRDAVTGAPVERFDLVLVRKEHRRYDRPSATGFHRGGIVCFDPLPRGSFELSVVPQDEALCASYFQPVHLADAAPAVVEVRLARAATRHVVVRRADGSPVGGARFELLDNATREERAHPDRNTNALTLEGWLNSAGSNHALLHQEGSTDERGEATLRGPADRLFAVRVMGAGNLPFVLCDVSLAAIGPLVLTVAQGARLRGTIGPASFLATLCDATPQPDIVRRRENEPLLQIVLSLAEDRTTTTVPVAPDGSFEATGLAAGTWSARFRGLCRTQLRPRGPGAGPRPGNGGRRRRTRRARHGPARHGRDPDRSARPLRGLDESWTACPVRAASG